MIDTFFVHVQYSVRHIVSREIFVLSIFRGSCHQSAFAQSYISDRSSDCIIMFHKENIHDRSIFALHVLPRK